MSSANVATATVRLAPKERPVLLTPHVWGDTASIVSVSEWIFQTALFTSVIWDSNTHRSFLTVINYWIFKSSHLHLNKKKQIQAIHKLQLWIRRNDIRTSNKTLINMSNQLQIIWTSPGPVFNLYSNTLRRADSDSLLAPEITGEIKGQTWMLMRWGLLKWNHFLRGINKEQRGVHLGKNKKLANKKWLQFQKVRYTPNGGGSSVKKLCFWGIQIYNHAAETRMLWIWNIWWQLW